MIVRIPKVFYDDHELRELPAPKIVRATKRHYYIDSADQYAPELHSDADVYMDPAGFDPEWRGVCASAAATVRALRAAGVPKISHDAIDAERS